MLQSGDSSQPGPGVLFYHHLSHSGSELELPHVLWRQGHVSMLYGPIHPIKAAVAQLLGLHSGAEHPRSHLSAVLSSLPHTWCQKVFLTHDKGNFQLLMFVGPVSGLPGELYFNIHHSQNDLAKPQSMASVSALSTHCMSAFETKENKIKQNKQKGAFQT